MEEIDLIDKFCIEKCANWILSHNYLKVGLEFVENQQYAPMIAKLLKNEIEFSPIVLESANRACGNCCVDEATAKPRNIDAIIHFGRTCLTPMRALPVLYVIYPSISIDLDCIRNLLVSEDGPKKTDELILVYDILCTPFIEPLFSELKEHFPHLILSHFVVPDGSEITFNQSELKNELNEEMNTKIITFNSRQIRLPHEKSLENYKFIYIGPNNRSFEPLQMRFSTQLFYLVDPKENFLSVSTFAKSVMSRSKKIEQIKEARTFGILNTLIKDHEVISNRIKKLIASSNKRYYSFYMGRINEAKLANIIGVDVFVYIGCPESSLFDRIEDTYLYKYIVTPWELEVTLNPSLNWSMQFETNFRELLKEEIPEFDEQKEHCEESLSPEWKEKYSSSLIERDPGKVLSIHEGGSAQALSALSWRGLNPQEEGQAPPGTVIEGKKGIPIQYESEMINKK